MSEAGGSGAPPLSVAQEALWYLSLLVPNQISYNEAITIRKDGPFDVSAFRRAFNEIVRRHEAWRTTFEIVAGEPVQVLQPPPRFDLPVLDLSGLTLAQAEQQAVRLAAQVSRVPYDLRRGPLLRPRLFQFPGEHHRLYLAMHHLVFDGVSVYRVVLPELVALYDAFSAGRPSPLPEPETRYADYARWEQEWITGHRVARRLEYWREHLTPPPVLHFPLDHPRPEIQRFRGGMVPLSVPADTVERLRAVGQSVGGTLFQVLATVWSLLLSRYSGQNDVVFATATDLRQRPEFEAVVGYSLTPLVIRVDMSDDPPFTDLVVRVRNELLDGLDNLVPFERLVRALNPEGMTNANPVYQTMFILEPPTVAPDPTWSIHQMESSLGAAVGNAKLDLELELDERPQGHIAGRLIYDRDLFEETTATRLLGHWLQLVGAVAADPTVAASRIPLLTAAEKHRQIVEWNATTTRRGPDSVHQLVAAQAARQPSSPAVSAGDGDVTYGELDRRADQVAGRLRSAGVRPGDVVVLASEPSVDLVVGLLGILKAGAAYLLLDPDLAPTQWAAMVADSGATVILAQRTLASRLAAPTVALLVLDDTDTDDTDADDTMAYDSGGSGTTETPGAVCYLQYKTRGSEKATAIPIRHDSVVNLATAMGADLGIGAADSVLVLPVTLFRAPVMELWLPLIAGARIVLAPADVAGDGGLLSRRIASERISFLHASPATWQTLIATGLKPSRALAALSGGSELTEELADQILDRCRVLWNAYGAAETTVYSTLARIERWRPVTIGGPLANSRVYVVDGGNNPVPIGITGQLLIAGLGVTSGYLNGSDGGDTFLDDPFGPGRAYRTGDGARWLANGDVQLVRTKGSS
ncbi:MAG TPA: condensation domain-containing protein [Acidimicrobiales bacterium]